MVGIGFSKKFSYAMAGVMAEMSDNIVQHSNGLGEELTGLIAFQLTGEQVSFAVFDIGKGLLASLKSSEDWRHLTSASAAIEAVFRQGASSRVGQGQGEGFRQLFKSLTERNSLIRLRADDSCLSLSRENGEDRALTSVSVHLSGVHVTVCSNLRSSRVLEAEVTF